MRRALGKGLAQLLGEQSEAPITELSLAQIRANPHQPRKRFDEDSIAELADSIRDFGLLQPLIVRPVREGEYELIAGERRWRAATLAGLQSVPVVVRDASEVERLQLGLVENVQREDISVLECAFAYQVLKSEFGLTQEEIARQVSKSRTAIANTLRLLSLPQTVQDGLAQGIITEGHARALLQCPSSAAIEALFYRVVDEGMTVRQTEQAARAPAEKATTNPKPKGSVKKSPDDVALEEQFSHYFGTPTKLNREKTGGKLTIEFYSEDDLERIVQLLGL